MIEKKTFLIYATLLVLLVFRVNKISEKQDKISEKQHKIVEAINNGVERRADIYGCLKSLQEVDKKLIEIDSLIVTKIITE